MRFANIVWRGRAAAAFLGSQALLIAVIIFIFGWEWPRNILMPFSLGAAVSVLNSLGLLYAWPRILKKKDVALAFGVIVSKFALSIGVVYWLTRPSTLAWLADSDRTASSDGVLARTSTLTRLSLESAFENPVIYFALGLAILIPAAVVAAWVEARTKEIESGQ